MAAFARLDISPGTLVLLSMDGFSAEEDYELFVPLHLIYHPDDDHVVIGSDLLNQIQPKADMKKIEDRIVREIYLRKDYSQILALTKPTVKSCLQVIDGRNDLYAGAMVTISNGSYSQIDKILTMRIRMFRLRNSSAKNPIKLVLFL